VELGPYERYKGSCLQGVRGSAGPRRKNLLGKRRRARKSLPDRLKLSRRFHQRGGWSREQNPESKKSKGSAGTGIRGKATSLKDPCGREKASV